MVHANITLGKAADNRVEIDGKPIVDAITSLTVRQFAGGLASLELDMVLATSGITLDGELTINAIPVSEEVGRQIYASLRARYDR